MAVQFVARIRFLRDAPATEPIVPPRDANFYADAQYLLNRGNRTCVRSAVTNVPLMKRQGVSQRNEMLNGKTCDSRTRFIIGACTHLI